MSLRWKLLIPTLLTSVLLLGGMLYISLLQYTVYKKQTQHYLSLHQTKLQANLQQMVHDTRRVAHFLVEDWRMADGLLMGNRDSLLELTQPFYAGLHFDRVTVYDAEGKVVVREDQPTWHGYSDELHDEVKRALHLAQPISIITLLNNQLLLVSFEALSKEIHGVSALVAVGYFLDNAWLQRFLVNQADKLDLQLRYGADWQLSVAAIKDRPRSQEGWHRFPLAISDLDYSQRLFADMHKPNLGEANFGWNVGLTIALLFSLSVITLYISHRLINSTVFSLQRARVEAIRAKRTAEIANQAKSSFLANMSHELRTPLNGILGYAQILAREHELNEQQHNGLNLIQSSGEYLLTLIDDILDLSKIEAGKVELLPQDVYLTDFINGIVEVIKLRATQKAIAFKCETVSNLPEIIHVDEKRLRQVLINLLGNAVKFTDTGSVHLQVGYDSGHLRFDVIDTGPGIPEAEQANIFTPFHQTGHRLKKAEGTGLGLAITQKLVTMMDGEISLESTVGKGSTFSVRLNLPPVTSMTMHGSTTANKHAVPTGYRLPAGVSSRGAYKILVADDIATNRSVLADFLQSLGFVVEEVEDGDTAVERVQTWQPDLVCTDVVMPRMDGLTATRLIKQAHPQLPVIIFSASTFKADRERAMRVGCNAFLSKPFNLNHLQKLLADYLALEWVFPTSEATAEANTTIESEDNRLPPEQCQELITLIDSGKINLVLTKIKAFQAEYTDCGHFLDQALQYAQQFQLKQLKMFLSNSIEQGNNLNILF